MAKRPVLEPRGGERRAARAGIRVCRRFQKGLRNDARLFGEVTASPTGQEWIRRFLDKDPLQSAYIRLVPF